MTGLLVVLLGAAAVLRLVVGESFGWPDAEVLQLRLDRLLNGLAVGAGLAVSGAVLQALLRNPLASPYLIGVSSGATLGVVVGKWLVGASVLGAAVGAKAGGVHLMALSGALGTLAVVYVLSQKSGWVDPIGLLLVGVIVNAINGAAIMAMTYLVQPADQANIAVWMMGYLFDDVPRPMIGVVLVVVALCTAVAACLGRAMDIATLTDAEAESLGVNLPRLRLGLFVLAAVCISSTVVLAGPIGFVGLICPHLVRLLVGPANRWVVLGSALAGSALVVAADATVKAIDVGQGLMPLGVLTAVIGGPVFLVLLRPQIGRAT